MGTTSSILYAPHILPAKRATSSASNHCKAAIGAKYGTYSFLTLRCQMEKSKGTDNEIQRHWGGGGEVWIQLRVKRSDIFIVPIQKPQKNPKNTSGYTERTREKRRVENSQETMLKKVVKHQIDICDHTLRYACAKKGMSIKTSKC